MQTLDIASVTVKPPKKFWARQFQEVPTETQKKFDWAFGVMLPIVCFYFDPIVFSGHSFGLPIFAGYKAFAYLMSFVAIMSMIAWLLWREKVKWLGAALAGVFAAGGIVSLCVGIRLFPISLIGALLIIGVFGFTPLIAGVIYLRNAVRVFRVAKLSLQKTLLVNTFLLTAIFTSVVPYVVNKEIASAMNTITESESADFESETRKLRLAAPLVNFEQLSLYYFRASDQERSSEKMQRIAMFYKEMTGEAIESRSRVLMD